MPTYDEAANFLGNARCREVRDAILADVESELRLENFHGLSEALERATRAMVAVEVRLCVAIVEEAIRKGFQCEKSNAPQSTTATTD